jgi:hypothetical protein
MLLNLTGCASTQLDWNTLDVASSVATLYRKQALTNLSYFIDDSDNIPSQVDILSGQIGTSNGVNPSLTLPLGNQVVKNGTTLVAQTIQENVRSLVLGVSAGWSQAWSIAPVSDGNALRRLRAVYRYVLNGDGDQLIKDYLDMATPTQDRSYEIDISRVKEPQCVVCMSNETIAAHMKTPGRSTAGSRSSNKNSSTDDRNLVSFSANDQVFYINPRLQHGWLYWKSLTSGSSHPCPEEAQKNQTQCVSLGSYGRYELSANRGSALGDLLLFLLPQADPRLPLPIPAGSQGGGGKSGAGT